MWIRITSYNVCYTKLLRLLGNPQVRRGKMRIAITVDEEVGHGVDGLDVDAFGANLAYTIDGDVLGSVEDETFNADALKIEIEGRSTHTGTAKNSLVRNNFV